MEEKNMKGKNMKLKDYATRILESKYFVEFHDITKIGTTIHGRKKDVQVYVAKVSAFEESQASNIEERHSNINYIGFEVNAYNEKTMLVDEKFRKGFMEYILMYYLKEKHEDRKNFKYYLGLLVQGDEGHFIQVKSDEVEKMFNEYMDKIINAKKIDDDGR